MANRVFKYKSVKKAIGTSKHQLKLGSEKEQEWLNELGKQGWELVNPMPYGLGGYIVYYFKKEIA